MRKTFFPRAQRRRRPSPFFSVALLLLTLLIALAACSSDGGVFGGGSWQSSGLVHRRIRTLAIDSNNPQAVYAGDAGGSIFASNDGGLHWSEHSAGLAAMDALHPVPAAINALSFDATGKKLYAATSEGLFVSTDAARHWQNVVAAPVSGSGYVALAFDLHASHTIYVGGRNEVLVSQNDGRSWSALAPGGPGPSGSSINSLTFDSEKHQLWAATTTGVYRFDSGNAGWQVLRNGLPVNSNAYAVQPASISGGTAGLVFAGTNQGFYRSVDGGAHWSQSQQSLARTVVRSLLVDFRKPSTVYVGTSVGVLRSVDSGQTWGGMGPGLPGVVTAYALLLGASNYTQLFAATGDVYLFPGTRNQFSLVRLLPVFFIALFFYVLYRFSRRNPRGKQGMLKSEQVERAEDAGGATPGRG
jgi:photosystem II stability/assembly factor-like uncharacterized protein